ncbi:unnamed protein product [Polarella glacialis]|uniref:Uncharacterized protein n=1 Tax=Polarella glacialis TaxID=89957 RepID=A0A813I697_POLGL|nr:unnamed protein product [Polarella glacialis]
MATVETSRWRQVFEAVLRRILLEYEGTEAKVRDGMESGMRKLFEKPYETELGAARKAPVTVEEAHRVIFAPRLSDMQLYCLSFSLDTLGAQQA